MDEFLALSDDPKQWRRIYDPYDDEYHILSKEEIEIINRIREGKFGDKNVDAFEPYVDWMEHDGLPLPSATEPKNRFLPSKWEAKKASLGCSCRLKVSTFLCSYILVEFNISYIRAHIEEMVL